MATNILMPALSPTMTEGTLARWLKKEGETVSAGDIIAEIETDKATMEVEAVDEGVLGKILVPDGTANVAVNAPIAVLVGAGEAVPDGAASGGASAPAPGAHSDSSAARPPAAAAAPAGSNGATPPNGSGGHASSADVPPSGYGAVGAEAARGSAGQDEARGHPPPTATPAGGCSPRRWPVASRATAGSSCRGCAAAAPTAASCAPTWRPRAPPARRPPRPPRRSRQTRPHPRLVRPPARRFRASPCLGRRR